MKKIKKSWLGFAVAGAFVLGVAFSFVPFEASADVSCGNKITCWSSGSINPEYTYVDCVTCTRIPGEWDSGEGKCKPGSGSNNGSNDD